MVVTTRAPVASRPVPADAARVAAAIDLTGFAAIHVTALVGVVAVGAPREAVAVGAVSYVVRCWGVVAGFHRYFSHRTFRLGRVSQFLVAVLGTLAMQKGVLWWVATHRAHHAHADTERDPHSPQHRSFGYSHCGWLFDPACQAVDETRVADWAAYPELRWLQRHRSIPVIVFAAALWLAVGPAGFVWGFALSSVVLWHALLATGSFSHRLGGYRAFATADASRNSLALSVLLLGDGWHNNHHRWPTSARQGRGWREPDPVWWSLRLLSGLGVAWGLRSTLPAGEARPAPSPPDPASGPNSSAGGPDPAARPEL